MLKPNIVISLLCALLLYWPAKAGDAVPQRYPVPISIEGERVRSSLLIQFDIERYNVTIDDFSARKLDRFETAFHGFLLALQAGDAASVNSFRPGEKLEQAQEITNRFQQSFTDRQRITIISRIYLGESQLFIWEFAGPKGRLRRGFVVDALSSGQLQVEIVYSNRPLETLIVDVMQQETVNPTAFAPVSLQRAYKYAAMALTQGKSSFHSVLFHFNGQPFEANPLSEARLTSQKTPILPFSESVLKAYQSAYRALKSKNLENYFNLYTDKSSKKLRDWLQKLNSEEVDSFYATATQSRVVQFIIDADPVALVFYTVNSETQLRYDYLLKSGSSFKFTNAYYEGFLDDVLGNPAIFPTTIELFRKRILEAKQ